MWRANVDQTAADVVRSYTTFNGLWYRPTPMHAIPWLTSHVIHWSQFVRLRGGDVVCHLVRLGHLRTG